MDFIPRVEIAPDYSVPFIVCVTIGGVTLFGSVVAFLILEIIYRVKLKAYLRSRDEHIRNVVSAAKSDRERERLRGDVTILNEWKARNPVPFGPIDTLGWMTLPVASVLMILIISLTGAGMAWGGSAIRAVIEENKATLDAYREEIEDTYGALDIDVDELEFPIRRSAPPTDLTTYGTTTIREIDGTTISETDVTLIWTGERFGLYASAGDETRSELDPARP